MIISILYHIIVGLVNDSGKKRKDCEVVSLLLQLAFDNGLILQAG